MSGADRLLVLVRLSDSFAAAVEGVLHELRADMAAWTPAGEAPLPAGVHAVLVLGGGAEPDAIDMVRQVGGRVPVFVVGADTDHRLALGAVAAGAADYFALPGDFDLLRRSLERVLAAAEAGAAARAYAQDERRSSGFAAIAGESPALRGTLALAERVAQRADVTVLIGGETGTGKELLARAIHYHGARASAPFVEINCAALPENLIESELFGHERGSFTGAVADKPGLFELAHGGTIFLDEIGHLPLGLQAKLLRALETREIRRVGGQQQRRVDVRVICATHVNLAQAAREGTFREDLYYRLNVVSLVLPPLRERGNDIEALAERFLAELATRYSMPVPRLTEAQRQALRAHTWPGNVRELRNAMERALVLSPPGTLDLSGLGEDRLDGPAATGPIPFPAPLGSVIAGAARAMLELAGGNKSEAARRLGISRPRLQRILDGEPDDVPESPARGPR